MGTLRWTFQEAPGFHLLHVFVKCRNKRLHSNYHPVHACRANYQAATWKRSLECCPMIPHPTRFGWCQDGDKLAIDWMSDEPAPTAIFELMSCSCSKSCKLPKCSCLSNGLKCTDMRKLSDCENRREDTIEDDVTDDIDQDMDDNEIDNR